MNRRDVSRLKTLQQEEPSRVSKMIRILWPEIRGAISRGHTLKVIRNRLEEIGIAISYHQFVVYVGRLRREDASHLAGGTASITEKTLGTTHDTVVVDEGAALSKDPLANVRDRLIHNRPGFNFEDGLPDKDKLIG
jgi:hypothetical protein